MGRRYLAPFAALALSLLLPAAASAVVVTHGYLPLPDHTQLNYTLTLPSATGKFPVLLEYDPYSAGVTSDTSWAPHGYAMLGVNFRGTGCSQGTFQPLRGDIWGKDGANVVKWAAKQPWSDGKLGMFGVSFTGVSQLATAEYAGPALKAINPENVFPDLYRDIVYPGGIYVSWITAWIVGRDEALGTPVLQSSATDPMCDSSEATHAGPDDSQVAVVAGNPYLNGTWASQPESFLNRVRIPVLGCVDWQDSTAFSRGFDGYRELNPATTWVVGSNGVHVDCVTSQAERVAFFDRYVKGQSNGWESTPHLVVQHEVRPIPGVSGIRTTSGGALGAWQSSFATWSSFDQAVHPLSLYAQAGGRLGLTPPTTPEAPDSYTYPTPSANTGYDFGGQNRWSNPKVPGGEVTYTTPRLTNDAEFIGPGSADLWVASTAPDTDVQVTLSEVRPDGQEMYIGNGWLRLSDRQLDPRTSTTLRPNHPYTLSAVQPLTPTQPVLGRLELEPFDHVFRAGSSIRLTIDAPGGYFAIVPAPASDSIYHQPGMASKLVLGWLPGAVAHAPLPPCGSTIAQPCRANTTPAPSGALTP
jgi:putative CocE/NonD family hydrolase